MRRITVRELLFLQSDSLRTLLLSFTPSCDELFTFVSVALSSSTASSSSAKYTALRLERSRGSSGPMTVKWFILATRNFIFGPRFAIVTSLTKTLTWRKLNTEQKRW